MSEQVDLTASALVIGDAIISLLQYSTDSIMICGYGYKTALILSIATMQKIKSISINTEVASDNYDQLRRPLVQPHLIPETDNRFELECDEQKFIYLRSVKTGVR